MVERHPDESGEPSNLLTEDRQLHLEAMSTMSGRRQLIHVAILSGLGLFCELLLIRWLDSEIRALAYVKNLPLIASFLGLGIGFALARRRRSLFPLVILLLAMVFALGVFYVNQVGDTLSGPAGPEINLGLRTATDSSDLVAFYLIITAVFALVVLAMVPLGQIAGIYMEGAPALASYTANVGGALAGILLFFAAGLLSLPPWIGAALVFAVCLAYLKQPRIRWPSLAVAGLTCFAIASVDHLGQHRTVWSPYNKIKVSRLGPVEPPGREPIYLGWLLEVQNGYYQRALDLSPETLEVLGPHVEVVGNAAYAYNYVYSLVPPKKVLIVGAGTGNDVAAALRNGAESVGAVEIDPMILRFGRQLHPERPYQDPRVRVIEADAREFLKRGGENYDMIVFGLLDSHTSFYSSLSNNIRLDNYVYTLEALHEAAGRLSEDGVLALAFYVEQQWVITRLGEMLQEVFGAEPLVIQTHYDHGVLFIAGPGTPEVSDRPEIYKGVPEQIAREFPASTWTSDDWPFLYLRKKGVPATVVQASIGFLAVTLVLVVVFFRGKVAFDRHLFFMGAGFLLVETRTIAQLGLSFGATWRVSAVTIGIILCLILAANVLIERKGPMSRTPLYVALGLGLVANYLAPTGLALGAGTAANVAMAVFYLLPLFFAALIFASTVARLENLATALASNLVGAVLGGMLESLAMWVGISALSLIAVAVYACSFRR